MTQVSLQSPPESNTATRAPFATGVVSVIIAIHLLLHFTTLAITPFGVHRDEFLYFSMGRHLRLWHMDFPPLIAILANLSRAAFDHGLAAARIFPAVEGAALVLLAALAAREMGGGRFAQSLAALCILGGGLFQRSSTLFQPVVLDQLWWTLGLYLLLLLSRETTPRRWLAFGLVMGLGLLTKFSILFFGFSVLIAMLATPARRWLATPGPWLAAGLAFLLGAPSVVGQWALGFPVIGQMRELQGEQLAHVTWSAFIAAQPVSVGPVPFLLAMFGAVGLVRYPRRGIALPGWTAVFAFLLLLFLKGKPYYIGPIYPVLFGAASAMLERITRWRIPLRFAVVAGVVAFGALTLPIGMPMLTPTATAAYAARLGLTGTLRTNRGEMDRLPQDFADMLGWREQSEAIARVLPTLTPAEREEAVILAGNYGEAGAAEFYGQRYSLPPVVSPAGSFWFFGPGERPGAILITIGVDSASLAPFYDDVRIASIIRSPWSVEEEREVIVNVGRKPKQSLQEVWPRLK